MAPVWLVLVAVVSRWSRPALGAAADAGHFIREPADVTASPGSTVQLDCELVLEDADDICAWKIDHTHLGVSDFYNAFPPDKVHALFPDHDRICSIVIEDIDWRHDGFWTCWPVASEAHVSSRAARVTVSGYTPSTDTPSTSSSAPATTSTQAPSTSTIAPSTTPEPSTTTPAPPTTSPAPPITTTTPPATTSSAPTPSPGPGFNCPQEDGTFADPDNDRYFYVCEDGIAVHMQCEWPKRWNDSQKDCV